MSAKKVITTFIKFPRNLSKPASYKRFLGAIRTVPANRKALATVEKSVVDAKFRELAWELHKHDDQTARKLIEQVSDHLLDSSSAGA
jgi:hypothetical protein